MPTLPDKIAFNLCLTVKWLGTNASFRERLCFDSILPNRMLLPEIVNSWCKSASVGDHFQTLLDPSLFIPNYDPNLILGLNPGDEGKAVVSQEFTVAGRFIDINKLDDSPQGHGGFARIVECSPSQLLLDLNHPLAGKQLAIELELEAIAEQKEDPPTPLDIAAEIRRFGCGLADAKIWPLPADLANSAMARNDTRQDEAFFAKPELNPFLQQPANAEIARLYRDLIADDARVLDLMAGVHSPLQDSAVTPAAVACAGLNSTELSHNPICTQRDVYNVNSRQDLPYMDASFDSVLIHAAIEYLVQPEFLFAEIARVLSPGGRIIVSFSTRSVEAKSIALWRDLHHQERCALIVDYLRADGSFHNLQVYSTNMTSDAPLGAVWAERK